MNEKNIAAKHVRNDTEIDGESARIRFAPEVVRSFAELEAVVRKSGQFDSDLLVNLRELASGKNYTVRAALTNMGLIVQETMEYVSATGDERAKLALFDLFDKVTGSQPGSKPVTVVASKAIGR